MWLGTHGRGLKGAVSIPCVIIINKACTYSIRDFVSLSIILVIAKVSRIYTENEWWWTPERARMCQGNCSIQHRSSTNEHRCKEILHFPPELTSSSFHSFTLPLQRCQRLVNTGRAKEKRYWNRCYKTTAHRTTSTDGGSYVPKASTNM
jgi:hypothetical protein